MARRALSARAGGRSGRRLAYLVSQPVLAAVAEGIGLGSRPVGGAGRGARRGEAPRHRAGGRAGGGARGGLSTMPAWMPRAPSCAAPGMRRWSPRWSRRRMPRPRCRNGRSGTRAICRCIAWWRAPARRTRRSLPSRCRSAGCRAPAPPAASGVAEQFAAADLLQTMAKGQASGQSRAQWPGAVPAPADRGAGPRRRHDRAVAHESRSIAVGRPRSMVVRQPASAVPRPAPAMTQSVVA